MVNVSQQSMATSGWSHKWEHVLGPISYFRIAASSSGMLRKKWSRKKHTKKPPYSKLNFRNYIGLKEVNRVANIGPA